MNRMSAAAQTTHAIPEAPLRILRLPAVVDRTGLKRSSIYARIQAGAFPKPISLGSDRKSVGWVEGEIDAWIRECIDRRGE